MPRVTPPMRRPMSSARCCQASGTACASTAPDMPYASSETSAAVALTSVTTAVSPLSQAGT